MIDIYEKLGNYGMDISKYVITGVVITTFFRSFDDDEYIIYLAGLSVSIAFMLLSFWAYSKHNDKEESLESEKTHNKQQGKIKKRR